MKLKVWCRHQGLGARGLGVTSQRLKIFCLNSPSCLLDACRITIGTHSGFWPLTVGYPVQEAGQIGTAN